MLAVAALWGLGKLPIERVAQEVAAARERLVGLVQVLGPAETPTAPPVSTPQLAAQVTSEPTPTIPAPTATEPPTATPIPAEEEVEPTALPDTSPTVEVSPTMALTETPTAAPTPPATHTPPPTATPTRSATGRTTYQVKSGDTLSSLATQFGITWEALAAANGLNSRSVLRIGQELIIPVAGAAPPPTAQPTAAPRPPATPTAAPTPAPSLPAPVQVSPADGAPFSSSATFELEWTAVPGVPLDAQYEVMIRWLDEVGAPQETPVRVTANATKVYAPSWLWGKAYQPSGRRYTWTVRVVQVTTDGQGREKVIPLSPASPARIFYWN